MRQSCPVFGGHFSDWLRYENLCGVIDEEISTPELVKSKDLCPHQDLLFLSPLEEDTQNEFREYHSKIFEFIINLKRDTEFLHMILNHPWILKSSEYEEDLCKDFESFFSIIIFLNSVNIKIPPFLLKIMDLKPKQIPPFDLKWAENLLNYIIHNKDDQYFLHYRTYIDILSSELKKQNAIENKTVNFFYNKKQIKKISNNINKLDSIVSIVKEEYENLKHHLRLLILTDFIRIDQFPAVGADSVLTLKKMGVVSIFEIIRRSQFNGLKIAILTGSIVVIPRESLACLVEIASSFQINEACFSFMPLAHDDNFICVQIEGQNKKRITAIITRIFDLGAIHVLVGTQALLGEGWDAPFVNSLIILRVQFLHMCYPTKFVEGLYVLILKIHLKQRTFGIWYR